MAIVIISCVDEESRRELAQQLARKLDCPVLSRERLVEEATESGIPVGKLEMAVLKQTMPRERLARSKAQYLAMVTAAICAQAGERSNLVYHGRAGNLLLPGVGHVLRVRLLPQPEARLASLARRLKLGRDKAAEYIRSLDADIANYVRQVHGVELNDPNQYDLMVNLENMSLESATTTICAMAQLPDFQPTPASRRIMEELYLAARARDLLGRDERAAWADLNVSVQNGRVTVTYMPGQAQVAAAIPQVLAGLEGRRELVCTMALTNVLWVAETFDPESAAMANVVDLAQRWGAAVELLRLLPLVGQEAAETEPVNGQARAGIRPKAEDLTGGVEDDVEVKPGLPDGGLTRTVERLIHDSLFGGSQTLTGGPEQVVRVLKANPNYSLVVVGEAFASKGTAARTRLTRELCGYVSERSRVPILTAAELKAEVTFGPRQALRLGLYLAVAAVIYGLVFTFQEPILSFLAGPEWKSWRVAATAGVALITPVVAFLYGGAMDLLLKWLRFE